MSNISSDTWSIEINEILNIVQVELVERDDVDKIVEHLKSKRLYKSDAIRFYISPEIEII